jgi:hypothetical protein
MQVPLRRRAVRVTGLRLHEHPRHPAAAVSVCAASEFGYRPDFAENYVCAWEPILSDTTDELA